MPVHSQHILLIRSSLRSLTWPGANLAVPFSQALLRHGFQLAVTVWSRACAWIDVLIAHALRAVPSVGDAQRSHVSVRSNAEKWVPHTTSGYVNLISRGVSVLRVANELFSSLELGCIAVLWVDLVDCIGTKGRVAFITSSVYSELLSSELASTGHLPPHSPLFVLDPELQLIFLLLQLLSSNPIKSRAVSILLPPAPLQAINESQALLEARQ